MATTKAKPATRHSRVLDASATRAPHDTDARPKRGRPITTGTTPAKDRKAKERATAAEQGGERLHVMLTAEGARYLRQIMADNDATKTEAVHIALERGR